MVQVNVGQNQGFRPETSPNKEEEEHTVQCNPMLLMVQRNQDDDQVLQNVQQNNFEEHNNINNMVEHILGQNNLNMGLYMPNFIFPLSEYVPQTELPKGWKVPKFTKFAGDTSESTIEHVARYQIEVGDIVKNKNLKMK